MKKLIAVLAIVCLISGVAFAQIGGTVFGGVNLVENDGDNTTASGAMSRLRFDGSGEAENGKYGGYIRANAFATEVPQGTLTGKPWEGNALTLLDVWGYAWWKPVDQFMLRIGSNGGDNFWGKEGVAAWGFYQVAGDVGVANAGNAWGGGYGENVTRGAFFGGFDNGLMMEIKPIDILAINIGVPFAANGSEVADFYQASALQIDVNLDFGNIALTMNGLNDKGKLFVFFGLGAVENLNLAVGFGYDLGTEVAEIGLAAKYGFSDSFALKFRLAAALVEKDTQIIADIMPIIGINETMTAFVSAGIAMTNDAKDMDFHFNPYIQIGEEWGPSFWAGFKLSSTGNMDKFVWSIPIAINFAF